MYRATATVSGSFRRHLSEVQAAIEDLKRSGVEILSPRDADIVGAKEGFTRLASDSFACIRRSHFLWVVCPDGHLGLSTTMEIGYALAAGVPVFARQLVIDEFEGLFDATRAVRVVSGPESVIALIPGLRAP